MKSYATNTRGLALGVVAQRQLHRLSLKIVTTRALVLLSALIPLAANTSKALAQSIPAVSGVLNVDGLDEGGASQQATQFRDALKQRLTDLETARQQVADAKAKYEENPCDETDAQLLDATARAFVLEFRADQRIVDLGTPLIDELTAAAAALVEAEVQIVGEIRGYAEAGAGHAERGRELDAEIQKIAMSVEHLLNTDEPLPSDVRSAVTLTAAEAGRERRLAEANSTVADNTRLSRNQYKSYVAALETYTGQVGDAVTGARSRLVEIAEMGRLMQAECLRARRGRAAGRFVENLGPLAELIAAIATADAQWAIPRVTGGKPIDTGPTDERVKQTLREYLDKHRRDLADSNEIVTNRE